MVGVGVGFEGGWLLRQPLARLPGEQAVQLAPLQELGEQVEVRRVLVARDELQQERVARQAGERAWLRVRVRVRVRVRDKVSVGVRVRDKVRDN